jgi:hypothetical protein
VPYRHHYLGRCLRASRRYAGVLQWGRFVPRGLDSFKKLLCQDPLVNVMNIEQFTETVYEAYDSGDEKTVALLAFEFPELYREYAIAEGLDDE